MARIARIAGLPFSDARLLCLEVGLVRDDRKLIIPAVEVVRALYAANKLMACGILEPDWLNLLITQDSIQNRLLRLGFSGKIPLRALPWQTVALIARILHDESFRSGWDSVQSSISKSDRGLLCNLPDLTETWKVRVIETGHYYFVAEMIWVRLRLKVEYTAIQCDHPKQFQSRKRPDAGQRRGSATKPARTVGLGSVDIKISPELSQSLAEPRLVRGPAAVVDDIPLARPLQKLCRQDTLWHPSPVPGTQVAEVMPKELNWKQSRRVILIRHTVADKERPCGKKLLEVEGYLFQALVTNLPTSVPPIEVWRNYNPRAGCENVIKQLDADFALDQLCLKKFFATEAAMSLAVLSYNLCILFQRHLPWADRVTAATLRYRLFSTPGLLGRQAGPTTLRLAVPPPQRPWWIALFHALLPPT